MAINLKKTVEKDINNIKGLRLGVANAGIKDGTSDLLVISLPVNSSIAGVFTQNQFCAAPVLISQDHLAKEDNIRALIINSGCANAGMGQQGMDDAKTVCKSLAKHLDINEKQVLPFSTGLILSKLPVEKINRAIPKALNNLNENSWLEAAKSIMTTDTIPKAYSKIINLKEIKLRPVTEIHDYNFKIKNAQRFLTKGDKVKFTVQFRGREMQHTDLGYDLMKRITDDTATLGKIEVKPKFEGRQIIMIIQPL